MIEFAVAGASAPIAATVPWLSLSILVPIVGALLVPFIPDAGDGKQVRWYALGVTLITFLITVSAYLNGYDPNLSGLQLSERVSWLPDLGLTWAVGADGLSMPLILLTSFITTLACLAAWPVSFKPRLFYFLLLAIGGGLNAGLLAAQILSVADAGLAQRLAEYRNNLHDAVVAKDARLLDLGSTAYLEDMST